MDHYHLKLPAFERQQGDVLTYLHATPIVDTHWEQGKIVIRDITTADLLIDVGPDLTAKHRPIKGDMFALHLNGGRECIPYDVFMRECRPVAEEVVAAMLASQEPALGRDVPEVEPSILESPAYVGPVMEPAATPSPVHENAASVTPVVEPAPAPEAATEEGEQQDGEETVRGPAGADTVMGGQPTYGPVVTQTAGGEITTEVEPRPVAQTSTVGPDEGAVKAVPTEGHDGGTFPSDAQQSPTPAHEGDVTTPKEEPPRPAA